MTRPFESIMVRTLLGILATIAFVYAVLAYRVTP